MKKTQEEINAFMNDYQALVKKHGIEIAGVWADSMELLDWDTRDTIAQDIDLDTFTADLYIKPLPMHGPRENKPPMSLKDAAKALGNYYVPQIADSLSSSHSFVDDMRNAINRQMFGENPEVAAVKGKCSYCDKVGIHFCFNRPKEEKK